MKKFLLFLFVGMAAFGQKPVIVTNDKAGWQKIGETTVNFRTESDEIVIMGADRFISLRFKATDAPVWLSRIELFFDGGDSQKLELDMKLSAQSESEVIPIEGGERKLKRISFVYKTLSNPADNRAHIEIFGLKS